MEHYSFWSLFPPVIAIILAIFTKRVYVSLLAGIWLGWVIIYGDILTGSFETVNGLVDVFKDEGNTGTIMFCTLVGALITFMQKSGGVQGFITWLQRKLQKLNKKNTQNKHTVQLITFIIGMLIFVESSISVLTVGAIFRPVFDQMKISREKLAYLADSSSAPSCILIPLNAWGAFIMAQLLSLGIDAPLEVLINALPYNFYAFAAIGVALLSIFLKKDWGPMKKAEYRTAIQGKILNDDAQPMIDQEATLVEAESNTPKRAFNMIIPLLVMILMMPIMLFYTGWKSIEESEKHATSIIEIIGYGSGSMSVLIAVLTSLIVAAILYRIQNILRFREMIDLTITGLKALLPLALLMILAFAIGAVCKKLGTGYYVAEITQKWMSPNIIPALLFLTSCFIAFATGTSWGTFAIMLAIAVPLAEQQNLNLPLTIAAVLSGGVFGDHCSPISDTTIVSSMASACDHIDHVRTQLPYAITAGIISFLLYLIMGFL